MESAEESKPASSPPQRPVFPPSVRREPEHELRDRAKAAKLRHRAAKSRVKANNLEDRARRLNEKAVEMDQRADELDGLVRTPIKSSVNE
jgi:hypothetical protein